MIRIALLFKFHQKHHSWTAPTAGMNALYADCLEHCVVNVTPPIIAAFIAQADKNLLLFWIAFISANTVLTHASLDSKHAIHHKKKTKNYGAGLMFFDRLYGTYEVE